MQASKWGSSLPCPHTIQCIGNGTFDNEGHSYSANTIFEQIFEGLMTLMRVWPSFGRSLSMSAASVHTWNLIPGKHPCRPKSWVTFKRPWVLTWDITVCSYWGYHWTTELFHVDIYIALLFPPIRNHPLSSHTTAAPSHRYVKSGYVCVYYLVYEHDLISARKFVFYDFHSVSLWSMWWPLPENCTKLNFLGAFS